jgi:hypothetical protein
MSSDGDSAREAGDVAAGNEAAAMVDGEGDFGGLSTQGDRAGNDTGEIQAPSTADTDGGMEDTQMTQPHIAAEDAAVEAEDTQEPTQDSVPFDTQATQAVPEADGHRAAPGIDLDSSDEEVEGGNGAPETNEATPGAPAADVAPTIEPAAASADGATGQDSDAEEGEEDEGEGDGEAHDEDDDDDEEEDEGQELTPEAEAARRAKAKEARRKEKKKRARYILDEADESDEGGGGGGGGGGDNDSGGSDDDNEYDETDGFVVRDEEDDDKDGDEGGDGEGGDGLDNSEDEDEGPKRFRKVGFAPTRPLLFEISFATFNL